MDAPASKLCLELSAIRTESILDNIPDGVYITDLDRRIVFWNRSAERITGWTRAEVVGRFCRDNILCHIDKDGRLLCGQEYCPLYRAIVTGKASRQPRLIFAQRQDQRRIPVEVTVAPLRNEDGAVIGGIEVFRDLSSTFEDLDRARIVQRDAVGIHVRPDHRVRLGIRYAPHDQVGGDFYRIERLDDDRYAIFVADIVGHGVASALYAMELRALWEEGGERIGQPAVYLDWLSHCVEKFIGVDAGYFATAIHVVYHADTGWLECATAGHPPAFIVRSNRKLETVHASGPGLGLISEPVYDPGTAGLAQGDSLLIYTDGALEIENARGEQLPDTVFRDLVRTSDLSRGNEGLADLELTLLQYSNGLCLPDDLTLISLTRLQQEP